MRKKYVRLSLHYPLLTCFLITQFFSCTQQQTPGMITAKDLLGSWSTIQGSAESITFAEESGKKMVYTYLSARLFETGEWQLKQNRLNLTFDSGEQTEYRVSIRNGKDLILRKASGSIEQYERVFTLAEKLTNWGIELGKQFNLAFSKASPIDFSWQIQDVDTMEGKTFPIPGYQIIALVPAPGQANVYLGKIKAIESYLDSLGFTEDPHNATETDTVSITGKIRYEEIIQIIASKNPDSTPSAPLKINLGALPQ